MQKIHGIANGMERANGEQFLMGRRGCRHCRAGGWETQPEGALRWWLLLRQATKLRLRGVQKPLLPKIPPSQSPVLQHERDPEPFLLLSLPGKSRKLRRSWAQPSPAPLLTAAALSSEFLSLPSLQAFGFSRRSDALLSLQPQTNPSTLTFRLERAAESPLG